MSKIRPRAKARQSAQRRAILLAICYAITVALAAAAQDADRGEADQAAAQALFDRAARHAGEDDRDRALVLLEQSFKKVAALSADVLSDARFEPLLDEARSRAKLRDLLREYAANSSITIAREDEPGDRIIVSGAVRNREGEPIAGALVYVYHTDERGIYSAEGDSNPRLFGFMRTDEKGQYEYQTIRPASYPNTRVDQHVHYRLTADGYQSRSWRLGFSDDPYWEGRTIPHWVAQPEVNPDEDAGGAVRFRCDIVMDRADE